MRTRFDLRKYLTLKESVIESLTVDLSTKKYLIEFQGPSLAGISGLLANLTKEGRKSALLTEQRLWIAYKDRSCQWWLNERGREGQVIHYPLCRAAVIENRIQILASLEAIQ